MPSHGAVGMARERRTSAIDVPSHINLLYWGPSGPEVDSHRMANNTAINTTQPSCQKPKGRRWHERLLSSYLRPALSILATRTLPLRICRSATTALPKLLVSLPQTASPCPT